MPITTDNKLAQLLGIIPWSRLVHSYGRASDFPPLVRRALEGDETAYREIANNIEHQSTLWHASPFMLKVVIELLQLPETNKTRLVWICSVVWDAASELPNYGVEEHVQIYPLVHLLGEQLLWEDFKDEDRDNELWECYEYTQEIAYNSYYHCLDLLIKNKQIFKDLAQSLDLELSTLATALCEKMRS